MFFFSIYQYLLLILLECFKEGTDLVISIFHCMYINFKTLLLLQTFFELFYKSVKSSIVPSGEGKPWGTQVYTITTRIYSINTTNGSEYHKIELALPFLSAVDRPFDSPKYMSAYLQKRKKTRSRESVQSEGLHISWLPHPPLQIQIA